MKPSITQALEKYFPKELLDKIQFSPVPRGQEGDLAIAFFQLAKPMKKSPIQLAQETQTALNSLDCIEKTVVSGPYLNVFFTLESLAKNALATQLKSTEANGKKIVIEYSGPNSNKPLHLGHMRNHALGIAVSNLYEACGANVSRVNIINDRGVAICKSMLAYQLFGNSQTPESAGLKSDHFVGKYYVDFSKAEKEDPSLTQKAQTMLLAWENNDPEVKKLWQQMNQWALNGHAETYERQGIKFDKIYKESDNYKEGREFAKQAAKEGHFYTKDDGSIWFAMGEEESEHKLIVRADGTTVYITQDLAVTKKRYEDFNFDEHIWVVADEQNYHFKVLIQCMNKLGLVPAEKMHHLGYGLVHLPDGRMKSREGTVVDSDPLMNELHELAANKIKENTPSKSGQDVDGNSLSEQEIYTIAEQIQNAAWKFYLLRTTANKTITFEKEKSIDFQGATGPYLQYAGVRIRSILNQAPNLKEIKPSFSENEREILTKISQWPDVLSKALANHNPTYIVTYLLELAQDWSSFYANNSVLKAKTPELMQARLIMAEKILNVLEFGLGILGIEVPEKM